MSGKKRGNVCVALLRGVNLGGSNGTVEATEWREKFGGRPEADRGDE